MQVKQWFTVSLLAVAAGAAMADQVPGNNAPLTRAEVKQSVIAARAAGDLIPAGDAADFPRPDAAGNSTLTRGEVRQEVLQARATGQLIPAGEGFDEFFARSEPSGPTSLTRAEVKAETLQARNAGELIPAGEGDETTLARDRVQARYARTALMARQSSAATAGQ